MVRPSTRGRKRPLSGNDDSLEERAAKVSKRTRGKKEFSTSDEVPVQATAPTNLQSKVVADKSGIRNDAMTPASKKLSVALPESRSLRNVLAVVSPETVALPPVVLDNNEKRQPVVGAEKRDQNQEVQYRIQKKAPLSPPKPEKQRADDTVDAENNHESAGTLPITAGITALSSRIMAQLALLWTGIMSLALVKEVKQRALTAWTRAKTFAAQYKNEEMNLFQEFKIHLVNMAGILKGFYSAVTSEIKARTKTCWIAIKKLRLDYAGAVADKTRKMRSKLAMVAKEYWNAEYGLYQEFKIQLVKVLTTGKKFVTVAWTSSKKVPVELKVRSTLVWTAVLAYLHVNNNKAKSNEKMARKEMPRKGKVGNGLVILALVVPFLFAMIVQQRWRATPVVDKQRVRTATTFCSATNNTWAKYTVESSSESSINPAPLDFGRYYSSPIGLSFVTQQLMSENDETMGKKEQVAPQRSISPRIDVSNQPSTSPAVFDLHSSPVGFAYVTQKLLEENDGDKMKKRNGNRRHGALSIFPIVLR